MWMTFFKKFALALMAAGSALATTAVAEGSITNTVPQWAIPSRWREITPGPAMVKAYSPMPESTNATIMVTVTHLPDVIHPERPPLALPRIELSGDKRDGSRSAVPLPDANDRATMLDLRGRDPDTFAPRRLIVINVARTNEEW